MATLAGSYKCKGHNTRYTYEATWDEDGGTARWNAMIFYDRCIAAAPSGETAIADDASAAVQGAVEAYIETVSCQTARGSPCVRHRDSVEAYP